MTVKNNKKSRQSPAAKTIEDPTLEAKQPAEPTNRSHKLTVVGIGASAGRLAALTSFFDTLSQDTGMAFVVVITFVNISALKESEEQLRCANETLEERVLYQANQKIRQTRDLFYSLFNANPIPTTLTRAEKEGKTGGLMRFRNGLALLGADLTSNPSRVMAQQ